MSKQNKPNRSIPPTVPEEDDDVMVTIDLGGGASVDCEILTIFDVNGQDYIALFPLDEAGEPIEDEIYFYRFLEETEGEPTLINIEDDEELEAVVDRFDELQDEAEFDEMDDIG